MNSDGRERWGKKADKHIQICKEIQEVVGDLIENAKVYFGTHQQREYQILERDSGENFWGINLYTTDPPTRTSLAKKPDVIVAKGPNLLYVIEVKWGWVSVTSLFDKTPRGESDLPELFEPNELNKIKNAISIGKTCRIGKLKFGKPEAASHKFPDFGINEATQFLLISDFHELMRSYPWYDVIMADLREQLPELKRLDYQQTYESSSGEVVQSFRDYVASSQNS